MSVGVVAQQGNERASALAAQLKRELAASGIETRIDRVTATGLGESGDRVADLGTCDLVASIGGDGTFLFTARAVGDTPIVGINLGEVGFLNAVAPTDATGVVRDLHDRAAAGTLDTQTLPRIVARGPDWELGPALNELIVHAPRRGDPTGIAVTVEVDGQAITSDRGDGIMVATPTGSTAYNLSEGGPLLAPDVGGLVITQMCGQAPMPSVVVPLDSTVGLSLATGDHALVISDGRTRKRVTIPSTVTVERAGTPVEVAGPPVAFFDAFEKLA